jgi:hypothetical protein
MLHALRTTALLDEVRGQSAVDRRAIATMLSKLSQWAVAAEPVLVELDLNPVLVGDSGPVAVDCMMVLKSKAGSNPQGELAC